MKNELMNREELFSLVNEKPVEEVTTMLESMKPTIELTSEYFELGEGEIVRAIYLGLTEFKASQENKDEEPEKREAVKLWVAGTQYVSASAVLVNALRTEPNVSPIQIENHGKVKMTGGREYVNFKVKKLLPREKSENKK